MTCSFATVFSHEVSPKRVGFSTELTGFPHLTKPIFDVSGEFLAVNQTPVDARPFCRAAFRNIKRWLEGTPPPAGRYIDGALRGTTFVITRDEEGNATGGVRAPHRRMATLPALPLGSYNGVDNTDPANVFVCSPACSRPSPNRNSTLATPPAGRTTSSTG